MKTAVEGPVSEFSLAVMQDKYSHSLGQDKKESWRQIAHRVSSEVFAGAQEALDSPTRLFSAELIQELEDAIAARKFMPGGRYLAASGRKYHQVQNCALYRVGDSREGWAQLMYKITMALMSGAGVGVVYSDLRGRDAPIMRTGGVSTGPCALMFMVNEAGRGIIQGGNRRSAIWAGLHWNHPDVMEFIHLKDWSEEVRAAKLKDYNAPAPLDQTNISILLDDGFFAAYVDESNAEHGLAHQVFWETVKTAMRTGDPGFSIDRGVNTGENLRNACVLGETEVLTRNGYRRIDELVGQHVDVWNGFEWSTVEPRVTGTNRQMMTVRLSSGQSLTCTDTHEFWTVTDYRGGTEKVQAKALQEGAKLIKNEFPVLPEGKQVNYAYTQGFLSGDGMDDYKFFSVYGGKSVCLARMSGTVGAYSKKYDKTLFTVNFDQHPKSFVPFSWNLRSRLDWFAGLLDSDGTELREGGSQISSVNRRFLLETQKMLTTLGVASKVTAATQAGMKSMPDGKGGHRDYLCQECHRLLVGAVQMQALKTLGLKCERLSFQKSPQRDASQFVTVTGVEEAGVADVVYCFNEPRRHLGCFDGIVTGQCTEITSRDDSDICNLGSINMARVESLEEMQRLVRLGTTFLLAGTLYSDLPHEEIAATRTKNRRLGLGLMGLHEWLLQHGKPYGPDAELEKYLEVYATSGVVATELAAQWGISAPVKTRAIAPTGTIGIVAETTTGIEPIFCAAYKRRYIKDGHLHYQYVVDPTAKRLVDSGIAEEAIEDAYTLSEDVERRLSFQAWLQKYVDHAISSTINMSSWDPEANNNGKVRSFGLTLMKYLPDLRGITVYPDGARSGQPLQKVKYSTAMSHLGEVFLEQADLCDITKGGSCGA